MLSNSLTFNGANQVGHGTWTAVILAVAALSALLLPLRFLIAWRRRQKRGPNAVRRVVVVGLDGFDPKLAAQFMSEGRLPNLQQLSEKGTFCELGTTLPALTPSAWSSFSTGVDASRHNIFDFITRDAATYLPALSSASISPPARSLKVGRYRIPLSKARVRGMRRSQPFWKLLGERGIFSSIVRMPITFPPEKFKNGVLLSGMCAPDLRGTQGEFTCFTSNANTTPPSQGKWVRVHIQDNRGRTALTGPTNPLLQDGTELSIPIDIQLDPARAGATLTLGGEPIDIQVKQYTPWTELTFKAGAGVKVKAVCRFYLVSLEPFKLYVTPLQIDPDPPHLPLSHPTYFAAYLAKRLGKFGTLGLLEDTDALNTGAIDEAAFLQQAYLMHEERERMLFHALDHTREGLVACVFDGTDRIQHMFFRTLDADHPANTDKAVQPHANVIPHLYARMDKLVGRVVEYLGDDPNTVLLVVSDHGFCSFKRGVNLNTWLRDNGYLALKENASGDGAWLADVDWQRTRAYALGLSGIYINRKNREAQGTVDQDALSDLKTELVQKLSGMRDPTTGEIAINRAWDSARFFSGPYLDDAPDILVGYNAGYRISWKGASGALDADVFADNTRHWSGDHCVDPNLVPGVLFSSRKISGDKAHILDMAPSILRLFDIAPPAYMQGEDLFAINQTPQTQASPPKAERRQTWEQT